MAIALQAGTGSHPHGNRAALQAGAGPHPHGGIALQATCITHTARAHTISQFSFTPLFVERGGVGLGISSNPDTRACVPSRHSRRSRVRSVDLPSRTFMSSPRSCLNPVPRDPDTTSDSARLWQCTGVGRSCPSDVRVPSAHTSM
eukprot:5273262-Prymnesium_polylepis.1